MSGAGEGCALIEGYQMSGPKAEFGKEAIGAGLATSSHEKRYSLQEMMAEVRLERTLSALGRELLDSTEIDKIFADQRRSKAN